MSVGIKSATVLRTAVRFSTIHHPEATTSAKAATCKANEIAKCDPQ
jgi:hypothetical protein